MRPVLHGDVSSAARVLLRVPRTARAAVCNKMIDEAEAADSHVRRFGTLHPLFGNGSLMSSARKRILADEPGFDDLDYCACFELVLRCLTSFHLSRRRS
ncbi:hypothetical protein QEZ52_09580 [Aliisedimentitalea scapharcae]|uniref:DUF7742 domain-containing protein n=1 Tax=Aliisedimentitalea scapharcae TaxID=1524259 RepID=A0ABZ2XXU6_9RHOB|nr:hypothetical protein K3727_09355 [Rhodobacteraceae bacterium M382]